MTLLSSHLHPGLAFACLFTLSCATTPHAANQASTPCVADAAKPAPLGVVEAIKERNAAMEAAFRRGDTQAVAGFYADDAVMLAPGGGRYTGRTAIDAYWQKITEPIDWQLDVIHVEGGDSLAVQRGRSTLVYRSDGKEHRSVVEFVLVWIRYPEGWKITVDAYWA